MKSLGPTVLHQVNYGVSLRSEPSETMNDPRNQRFVAKDAR